MKDIRFFVYLITLILISQGCFEEQSGCVDSRAKNYDVSADDACGDCCSYPSIKLTLRHVYDTLNFSTFSIYEDDFGNPFQLTKFSYFLTEPALLDTSGNFVGAIDKILVECQLDGSLVTDSIPAQIGLVNSQTEILSFNIFKASGDFDQLSFKLGLEPCTNHIDTNSIDEDHILRIDTDSLYIDQNSGYHFLRFSLIRDTSSQDLTFLEWSGDSQLTDISLPGNVFVTKGEDASIEISVDMKKWFNSIDVVNDSSSEIVSKLKSNVMNSFDLD